MNASSESGLCASLSSKTVGGAGSSLGGSESAIVRIIMNSELLMNSDSWLLTPDFCLLTDPRPDRVRHVLHFLLGEFRVHGERKNAGRGLLGERQRVDARLAAPGEPLLLVNGDRVVGQGRDAPRGEIVLQAVAVVRLDDVQVVDVPVAGRGVGQRQGQISQEPVVFAGQALPEPGPFVHPLQLDAQYGGVEVVQAAIVADAVVRAL